MELLSKNVYIKIAYLVKTTNGTEPRASTLVFFKSPSDQNYNDKEPLYQAGFLSTLSGIT